jgi:hypothetical protein
MNSKVPGDSEKRSTVRIPLSCLAEFATTYGRRPESILRPYRFNKQGEGFARSSYYQLALKSIREYHQAGNDPEVFERVLSELREQFAKAKLSRDRSKISHNISAIEIYWKIYGQRKFKILPCHRLSYSLGLLEITVKPDLWVEENGVEVLLKIGVAKKKPSYIDIVLTIIRKAAAASGRKIRARNIIYLDVSSGRELVCGMGLTRFNRTFLQRANEIARYWAALKPLNETN